MEKKKVGIALKASLGDDDSSEDSDEEIAMLARRFTRFMKSNRAKKFQRLERKNDFKKL